jgi:hypothetical protein
MGYILGCQIIAINFPIYHGLPADGFDVSLERRLVITQFIAALTKELLIGIAPQFLHDGKRFLFHGVIIPQITKKVNI